MVVWYAEYVLNAGDMDCGDDKGKGKETEDLEELNGVEEATVGVENSSVKGTERVLEANVGSDADEEVGAQKRRSSDTLASLGEPEPAAGKGERIEFFMYLDLTSSS